MALRTAWPRNIAGDIGAQACLAWFLGQTVGVHLPVPTAAAAAAAAAAGTKSRRWGQGDLASVQSESEHRKPGLSTDPGPPEGGTYAKAPLQTTGQLCSPEGQPHLLATPCSRPRLLRKVPSAARPLGLSGFHR